MNISIVQLEVDGKTLVVGLGLIGATSIEAGGRPRFVSQFDLNSPTLERDIEEWKTRTLEAHTKAEKLKSALISNLVSFPSKLAL